MRLKARGDGGAVLTLDEVEVELLRQVPEQLRVLYEADTSDPARGRLFPRAYLDPTEEAAEEQWTALVHPGLLRDRLDALERMTRTLDAAEPKGRRTRVTLEADDVSTWLAVLNDARLAFGTKLGIADDTDVFRVAPDDPLGPERAAYGWLTTLQGALVETMLGTLPD